MVHLGVMGESTYACVSFWGICIPSSFDIKSHLDILLIIEEERAQEIMTE
jgi:hypothetical protein